jgi:hypothetical protein
MCEIISDYVVLVAGGEREDGMAVPRANFDNASVEAETLDLPVVGIGKGIKGGTTIAPGTFGLSGIWTGSLWSVFRGR